MRFAAHVTLCLESRAGPSRPRKRSPVARVTEPERGEGRSNTEMGLHRGDLVDPDRHRIRVHASCWRRPKSLMAQISVRRGVFFVVVLLTLALAGLFAGMVVLMNVQPGFLGMAHFTELHHRIHDLSFAFLNATTTVGMLAQLRRPVRNVASQLMALVPFAALLLSVVLTNWSVLSPPWLLVGAAAVLATMLHPAGGPLRSFSFPRADRPMLALIGIPAVPLLAFAFPTLGPQPVGACDS